jgi:tetratricopeptide (TPR) repeat protein
LGPALFAASGFAAPEVGETIARGLALAERLERTEYLVPLLYGQWVSHNARAELGSALSFAEQLGQIGETRKDVAVVLLGHTMQGITYLNLGECVAARTHFEQCHSLNDPAHRVVYAAVTAEDPCAVMLAVLALTLTYLGYVEQGRSRMNEAFREARRLEHACTLTLALSCACRIKRVVGPSEDVQRHAEEVISLSNEYGFPHRLAEGYIHRGWSLTAIGQVEEGLTLLAKALSTLRATGTIAGTPLVLTGLAEAYAVLGQSVEGLNCLAEAAQIIEKTEERRDEAELHRVRGDLLNAIGDRAAAEQSYRQALAVAERQSAKFWELRAATSLARLWRDQGKRTEARDLLAPIYGWFTEGHDTPVLKDAKALLDELA